jgi:hypothetical protein
MLQRVGLIRIVAAVAVLVSAYVHLRLWLDGVRHQDVIGPAFMLNAVAGVVIAILLVAWHHWLPGFLTAGFGASTLAAFTIASTVGLFDVHTEWKGGYVWTAAIAEVVAIVTGLLILWRESPLAGQLQHRSTVGGAHLH